MDPANSGECVSLQLSLSVHHQWLLLRNGVPERRRTPNLLVSGLAVAVIKGVLLRGYDSYYWLLLEIYATRKTCTHGAPKSIPKIIPHCGTFTVRGNDLAEQQQKHCFLKSRN